LAYHGHSAQSDPAPNGITPSVHAELEKLRPVEAAFRRKWLEDESGWHKLPPRAWPLTQPKHDELDELKRRAETEGTEKVRFDLATCLTFNGIDPVDGLRRYKELAAGGNLDATVAVATVLLEGIGRNQDDVDVAEGVRLLRDASDKGHVQAHYELGTLHYLGSHPKHVPEDEARAFHYFERAAAQQHTSALFMLAEFLIEGNGCTADEARAVPLLHAAAERGHRMARQYIRDYLDLDARQNAATASVSVRARAQVHAEQLPSLPSGGSEHFCIFRGSTGEKASAFAH
jgi:TPR repeat protein